MAFLLSVSACPFFIQLTSLVPALNRILFIDKTSYLAFLHPKTRTGAKMSILTPSMEHGTEITRDYNKAVKRNGRDPNWKERSKTLFTRPRDYLH